MPVTEALRGLVIRTAPSLPHGATRRQYRADPLTSLDLSQRPAQTLFGWGRDTLRTALPERRSGMRCCDAFARRGRKPVAQRWPHFLEDLRDLVQEQCQTDGTFRTTRLYGRRSAAAVGRPLVARPG
jgi:hypothetical protein